MWYEWQHAHWRLQSLHHLYSSMQGGYRVHHASQNYVRYPAIHRWYNHHQIKELLFSKQWKYLPDWDEQHLRATENDELPPSSQPGHFAFENHQEPSEWYQTIHPYSPD